MMLKMRRLIPFALLGLLVVGCSEEPQMAGGADSHVAFGENAKPAKDFTVMALNSDKKVKLSDLKGKVVLIDFWATWCGPCKAIMPTVDELYHRYKDKGFEVMAITDEDNKTVQDFVKKEGYSYSFYLDFTMMAKGAYNVEAIPSTFLVDREGKIVYSELGAEPNGLAEAVGKAMAM